MSTSSGARSRPPAHQNAVAFRHNKRSKLTDKIERTVDTQNLCPACARKIEWRKKYRKYKPLSVPRRCNRCHAKRVLNAYHTLCADCAAAPRVCAVCAAALRANSSNEPVVDMHDARVAAILDSLPERDRRTVLRLTQKGTSVSDAMGKIGLTLVKEHPASPEQPMHAADPPTHSNAVQTPILSADSCRAL